MYASIARAALALAFVALLACAGQTPDTGDAPTAKARGGKRIVREVPPGFKFPRRTPPAPQVDSTAAFTVHIAPTGSCDPGVIQGMSCGDVRVVGDNAGEQDVFICMSGVESFAGSGFAVEYPPTVDIVGWDFCASMPSPAHISGPTWPASRSYIVLAWARCQELEGDLHALVRLRVAAGSTGLLSVVSFQGQDLVPCHRPVQTPIDESTMAIVQELLIDPSCGLGSVSVGGEHDGEPHNACGACR